MLGLYIHIPFCARRCPYCDFAILPGAPPEMVADYIQALQQELSHTLETERKREAAEPLRSIFFGGGTPSYLEGEILAGLLRTVLHNYEVTGDAEITLEANPEDATLEKLETLTAAGWNRISFGAQSFSSAELKMLGRRHNDGDIASAIATARRAGFDNISLDLIYATPGQTKDQWQKSLEQAVRLEVSHLSCYSLTIESGTNFGRRAERGTLLPMADDDQGEMMQLAEGVLTSAGYERYEISNYAKPGYSSRHNENYWRGGDYLACGNSAHGHRQGTRWWNERDPKKYIAAIMEQGSAVAGEEHLTARQRLDELVMLGLRTRDGFSPAEISSRLDLDVCEELNGALEKLLGKGMLESRNGVIRLTEAARPLADAVAIRLLS